MSDPAPRRLLLLRHGQVDSHRGDVPITEAGVETALQVGRDVGKQAHGRILVLTGETLRARQTGAAMAEGARGVGSLVDGPRVAFALRNPDLYLGGVRVDMVSTPAALAEQVAGMGEEDAAAAPFFAEWLAATDRVGWWVRHPDPPGDDAATVRRRIQDFARSLTALGPDTAQTTVAVTHSPVLRACALAVLDADPGEPDWLAGLEATIHRDGTVTLAWLDGTPR
jgi:broad specificity phosphatase PhoE